MALTPLRWIAAAVIGALALLALVLSVDLDEPRFLGTIEDPLSHAEILHARRVRLLGDRFRAQVHVERARAAPTSVLDAGRGLTIRIAGMQRPELAAEIRPLAERTAGLLADSGHHRVDVVFVPADSVFYRQYDDRLIPVFVIPRRDDEPCQVIIPVAAPGSTRRINTAARADAAAERLLGPCRYFQAFGRPGDGIADWLSTRGWHVTFDGSWEVEAGWDAERWGQEAEAAPWRFLEGDAFACAGGSDSGCVRTVMRQRGQWPTAIWGNSIIWNRWWSLEPGLYTLRDAHLGPLESEMLAAMVRTMGRERFAAFWRSPDDVLTAFQSASGEPMPVWLRRTIRSSYGPLQSSDEGSATWMVLWSIILAGGCAFAGVRIAQRRQFA